MKKLMSLLVVLAIVGMSLPAMAQEVDKSVIVFRTMDDPDIPPDPNVCARGQELLEVPFWNVLLGASSWSVNTRSNIGEVVVEKVRQIGTGTACSLITDPTFTPFAAEAPFYFEGQTGDVYIAAAGECEVTHNDWGSYLSPPTNPEGPVYLSCYLDVLPELSTPGIKSGQATSNSTFVPVGEIPGFETGSFWTIQLIWDSE